MRTVIAIGGNILFEQEGLFAGYPRAYVNADYVEAVKRAGAVPLILPPVETEDLEDLAKDMLAVAQGLVLSGGYDVNPLLWGAEPSPKLGETLAKRDAFDLALIRAARQQKLPVLGICRGLQILNVEAGGTLYQDISEEPNHFVRHWQQARPAEASHTVTIEPQSTLAKLFGAEVQVNSFHHMATKDVGKHWHVTARAKDGTVEGMEHEALPWLAVQWHPEMMAATSARMQKLFTWLFETAQSLKGM